MGPSIILHANINSKILSKLKEAKLFRKNVRESFMRLDPSMYQNEKVCEPQNILNKEREHQKWEGIFENYLLW